MYIAGISRFLANMEMKFSTSCRDKTSDFSFDSVVSGIAFDINIKHSNIPNIRLHIDTSALLCYFHFIFLVYIGRPTNPFTAKKIAYFQIQLRIFQRKHIILGRMVHHNSALYLRNIYGKFYYD